MFKNIIFDWSGVIKDALDAHLWVVNRIMIELGGKEISVEEFKEKWEEPYMNFWKKYYPQLTSNEEVALYHCAVRRKDYPKSDAYEGISDLIMRLKDKGVRMVVLTADLPETILQEIKDFGLEGIFDEVNHSVHDKSEAIHELIKRNNFRSKETVFVGDSKNEIIAGEKAGVKTIAVTWGLCAEKTLRSAGSDYLAHNVKELEEILLK